MQNSFKSMCLLFIWKKEEYWMEFSKDTIFLVNYGRQNCEDMHSWGPGMRSCYVIHYVIRGSGYLECGKK